jgi:hypothetical protein
LLPLRWSARYSGGGKNVAQDPTRKDNGVANIAQLRRAPGLIVIQWDPNTGQLGYKSEGLTPVEEVGLYTWMTNLRMGGFLNVLPNKQVSIASPTEMPPPPKVS